MSGAVEEAAQSARRLRHALHDLAEGSHEEERTAARVQAFLEDLFLDVETGVGGHGLLARVGEPPYRLLRAELDALPLVGGDGHRHGCGHDGHMAMLAGAAQVLSRDPPERGVAFLFQSAEEDGSGMADALRDPRLGDLEVEAAYSVHNLPGIPLGTVVLSPGALASVGLRLRLVGSESHAAQPGEGNSPWHALERLADLVPHLRDGLDDEQALATLIHVRLGTEAYGTSPGTGVVAATLRGAEASVAAMRGRWTRSARTWAAEAGLGLDVSEVDPFPETRNDGGALERVEAVAQAAGLEARHHALPFPWSEDVGHAVKRWGGALVGLGSGEDQPPLHDDDYGFPDDLLEPGVRFWTTLARSP